MRRIYYAWAAGLLLKLVGASWDVAWHFRYLRDLVTPPHFVNILGELICAAALIAEWRSPARHRRGPMVIVLAGVALFALAIPIDQFWHVRFGIDLTTWSPAHLLLFSGTAIAVVGIVLMFLADVRHERGSLGNATRGELIMLALLLIGLAESVAFPLAYNEYTTVAAREAFLHPDSMDVALVEQAHRYAPDIDHLTDAIFLGTPHWLYPVFAVGFAVLLGTVVRAALGPGWALLTLAGLSAERALADAVLVGFGWPNAVVPLQYVGMGLALEAAWLTPTSLRTRAVAGGVAVALAAYVYFVSPPPWLPSVPLDASSALAGILVAIAMALLALALHARADALAERGAVEWERVAVWARDARERWAGAER